MARLSAKERARHQSDLAAAFAVLLGREAGRVAEQLRHRSLHAAANGDGWWDNQRAADETASVLRPAIHAAALASAGAVASAYKATYHPDAAFDSSVKAQVDLATQRTVDTSRAAFADLIDDADNDEDAADAVDRYAGLKGRADLVGLVEISAAVLLGGRAAINALADRPDEDRVSAKTWVLSPDHETEDDCDLNDGDTIAVEDDWPGGDPGDLHFGCACSEEVALVSASELTASASSPQPAGKVRTIAAMTATMLPGQSTAAAKDAPDEALTAAAIASHTTDTTDEPWDGRQAEKNLSNDDGAAEYRQAYAWVNPAGDPDKKNSYWGPHHMVDDNGKVGAANVTACSSAIASLNGARGASGVPAGDRQTVYNHLAKHLRDSGRPDKSIPDLKASAMTERVHIPREVMEKVRRYCAKNNITLELSDAITASPDGSITVEGGAAWHAVATVEGVAVAGMMGKREFAPGSLKTRALPLPLMLQREATHGSGQPGGSVICGAITEATRDGARILNAGVFDTSPDGQEAERLVETQMMRFVSIDAEVLEYELVMGDDTDPLEALFGGGDMLERYTDANALGLTIVPFPAYAGCVITLADVDLPETSYDDLGSVENPDGPLAIAAGAAWAATAKNPPASWFQNPNLAALTHARVTPEGRVYGHVAPWKEGHVGYQAHRPAPRSPSAYSYFLTGRTDVEDTDGTVSEVPTGPITLGTTHAASRESYAEAVSHYDHTGYALADVVVGEDRFGIWMSGALRPTATAEQVRVFKASDVSGDWRPIRGAFDLIGILTVNAAGFPISGSLLAAAAALVPDDGRVRIGLDEEGRELSLVAAGVIRQGPATQLAEMARRLVALEEVVKPLQSLSLERVVAALASDRRQYR